MNIAQIWSTCLSWLGRAKQRPWIVIGTLALVGGGIVLFAAARGRAPRGADVVPVAARTPAAGPITPNWLDGSPLPEGEAQPSAVAVVVDNAPESRPQEGIAAASVVFEVPVEGRRTRFLAVYPENASVARVGPVRSARPYFVGLAEVVSAPLVHVGGSPAALDLLRNRPHVNQYYDPPFVRDRARLAPFNVFTVVADLVPFTQTRGLLTASPPSLWSFAEQLPADIASSEGFSVRIPFSGHESSFVVEWKYDNETGVYIRRRGGAVVRDASGAEVAAKNVVVLRVRSRVLDRVGRLAIPVLEPSAKLRAETAVSVERAVVFVNGKRVEGGWGWEPISPEPERSGDVGRFGIRQDQNVSGDQLMPRAIPLAPGKTWVEIVDFDWE